MRKFTVSEVACILSDEDLTWQYQDWRTKEWVNAEGESMLDDDWYEVGGMRFQENLSTRYIHRLPRDQELGKRQSNESLGRVGVGGCFS